ncbi:MAG: hypothetical protein AAF467_21680 [Actinomycetota bacterium]
MVALLFEGFEAVWLPCSLVLLVPGLAATIGGRAQPVLALAGFAPSMVLASWVRFSERGGDWPTLVIAAVLAVAAIALALPADRIRQVGSVGGGVLAGGAAAALWEPCVGPEFGLLLNTLPDRGADGLALMAVYGLGLLAPLAAAAAVLKLVPEWMLHYGEAAMNVVGAAALGVMAATVAVGLHDEVIGQLFRWSLG